MDIKYLEENFINECKKLHGNRFIIFYIPTNEHSSGFDEVELKPYEKDKNFYNVYIEGELTSRFTFDIILKEFPFVILDRKNAFERKFACWKDIELALKEEKEIDLVRL